MLDLEDVRHVVEQYYPAGLVWRWRHSDPRVDEIARCVLSVVHAGNKERKSRREVFRDILHVVDRSLLDNFDLVPRTTIPYMEEPWFC